MCTARPCRCSCDLIPVADSDAVRAGPMGSFAIDPSDDYFYVKVPGAAAFRMLPLRRRGAPEKHPSWEWDGDRERPTLSPSVRCWEYGRGSAELWHGHIKKGRAESC